MTIVHSQYQGRRVWKIVGQAETINVDEVRGRTRTVLAAIRDQCGEGIEAPPDTPFETVAEEVFRRYARNWKRFSFYVDQATTAS